MIIIATIKTDLRLGDMMILKNKNYKNYIFGRVVSNFGDSIFMQLLVIYFTLEMITPDKYLAINKILQNLPCLLIIFIGPFIDRYKNKKRMLIYLEFALLLTTIIVLVSLNKKTPIIMLGAVGVFYFANLIKGSVEMSLKKYMVMEKDLLGFNRIFRLTGKILDMFADAISFYIINFFGYVISLVIDICTFIFSLFSFSKIDEIVRVEDIEKKNVLEDIKGGVKHFFNAKNFSKIVIFDGILCGLSSLFMIYFPIYLNKNGILYVLPIYLFLKSLGWFIGTYLSVTITKHIYKPRELFYIDYIAQTFLLLSFFLNFNIYIILVLALISSIPQSVTGVMYDTWALEEYEAEYMGRVDTLITFGLYSSSILATTIPLFCPLTFEVVIRAYLLIQVLIIIFGLRLLK